MKRQWPSLETCQWREMTENMMAPLTENPENLRGRISLESG